MAGPERPDRAGEGRGRLNDPHAGAIADELVARLAPLPGERWLDLACGAGEIALRAARAGASVTALDTSVDEARGRADAEHLAIDFVPGDVRRLPFSDGSFDVIASSFGVVDAEELLRVVRTRFGFTTWEDVHLGPGVDVEVFSYTWHDRPYSLVIGQRT